MVSMVKRDWPDDPVHSICFLQIEHLIKYLTDLKNTLWYLKDSGMVVTIISNYTQMERDVLHLLLYVH